MISQAEYESITYSKWQAEQGVLPYDGKFDSIAANYNCDQGDAICGYLYDTYAYNIDYRLNEFAEGAVYDGLVPAARGTWDVASFVYDRTMGTFVDGIIGPWSPDVAAARQATIRSDTEVALNVGGFLLDRTVVAPVERAAGPLFPEVALSRLEKDQSDQQMVRKIGESIAGGIDERMQTPRGQGQLAFEVGDIIVGLLTGRSVSKTDDVVEVISDAGKSINMVDDVSDTITATRSGIAEVEEGLVRPGVLVRGTQEYVQTAQRGKSIIADMAEKTAAVEPRYPVTTLNEVTGMAEKSKASFDSSLKMVAKKTGGTAVPADLKTATTEGLERAQNKIVRDYEGDAGLLKDELRGSLVYGNMDDLYASVETITKKYDVIKVKDNFAAPKKSGYRDINMIVRNEDGSLAEIQLHVKPIYDAKQAETKLYNQIRDIADDATPEIKARIETIQGETNKLYSDAWASTQGDLK
jgi:hypothetical protein